MPTPTSSSQPRLAGKIALVTGAGSGIGRATAILMAQHGAAVTCADLNLENVQRAADEINAAGGSATACELNVASESAWRVAMDDLLHRHGKLDIVVNCAGIAISVPVAETSLDQWRRVMEVNLDGVFLGTKHGILAMRETTTAGSIVNVSSMIATFTQADLAAYGSTKAGIITLSKTAALECQRSGYPIRINTVSPGGIKTAMWLSMPFVQSLLARIGNEEATFEILRRTVLQGSRWGTPEDVAPAILFLASDESAFVNGTDLLVDNAITAGVALDQRPAFVGSKKPPAAASTATEAPSKAPVS